MEFFFTPTLKGGKIPPKLNKITAFNYKICIQPSFDCSFEIEIKCNQLLRLNSSTAIFFLGMTKIVLKINK